MFLVSHAHIRAAHTQMHVVLRECSDRSLSFSLCVSLSLTHTKSHTIHVPHISLFWVRYMFPYMYNANNHTYMYAYITQIQVNCAPCYVYTSIHTPTHPFSSFALVTA